MATTDDDFVRNVYRFFYPTSVPGEINEQLRTLAATMVSEAVEGSRAMDLVPRPPAVPSPTWLLSQIVQAAWRRATSEHRIYDAVKNTVALKHRSEYEMAKMGI